MNVLCEYGSYLVTFYGSGMRIYCAFRENMIQIRGDFCVAKLSISPRIVTMSGSQAVNSNQIWIGEGKRNRLNFPVVYAIL